MDLSEDGVAELEEGELLELPPRDPVVTKTDVKYESEYKSLEELGKGKFGVVNKCRNKTTGEILAAKFVRKTAASKKEVTREIAMMNLLHHKRLIQLYDAFETEKDMIVIMELVTGGELFEKVVEEDNLTERQVIRYMKQVLYGVEHMHKRQMVHLDLKPENILCLGGGKPGYEEIKLIDFGMTRVLVDGEQESTMCGTPEFVAPEVITFNPITVAADMWSIGVITYVLLSGLSPFMGDNDNETLKNVTSGEYDFEDDDEIFEHLSDEVKQFIEDLLILNPKKRLTVEESLQHTWLTKGGSEKKINTSNLKKFIARRRWQRTMNTIKAVSRLAGGLSLFGKKSGAHGLGKGGFLEKVKRQQEEEEIKEREGKEKRRIEEEEGRKNEQIEKERLEKAELQKRKQEEQKKEKERVAKEHADIERKKENARKELQRKKKEEEIEELRKEEVTTKEREKERLIKEKIKKEEEARKEKEKLRKEEEARKEREKIRKAEETKEKLKKEEEARKEKESIKKEQEGKLKKGEEAGERERKKKEDIEKQENERIERENERKQKRTEERKRRQEQRKRNEAGLKNENEKNTTVVINTNDDKNNNNNDIENINVTRTAKNVANGIDSPKLRSRSPNLGNRSPKLSSLPALGRRPPAGGSITNRIAAFQQGDMYWKNKK